MNDESKILATKVPIAVSEAAANVSPLPQRSTAPTPAVSRVHRSGSALDEPEGMQGEKLDLLRQLRAETQGLQSLLAKIRDGRATLGTYAGYIDENRGEIEDLFERILEVLPDGHVAQGDNIRHIQNQWQMLVCSPVIAKPSQGLGADEQVKELALCDQLCHDMVSEIGQLTIPARLNVWLKDGWNGYLLPFHDLFADELPRVEDRQRLLKLLASVPGLLRGGIVEPTTGCIFPYHHEWYKRCGVCAAIALGYLGATLGIWLLSRTSLLPDIDAGPLVINWVLVMLGVITHYAVARTKNNGAGGVAAIPLGHPTYVVDARAGVILLKGLLMLVGFFGLLLLDAKKLPGHLDFFLVGYSLDSFAGIVSSSLDQRAAARGSELGKRLGI